MRPFPLTVHPSIIPTGADGFRVERVLDEQPLMIPAAGVLGIELVCGRGRAHPPFNSYSVVSAVRRRPRTISASFAMGDRAAGRIDRHAPGTDYADASSFWRLGLPVRFLGSGLPGRPNRARRRGSSPQPGHAGRKRLSRCVKSVRTPGLSRIARLSSGFPRLRVAKPRMTCDSR